MAVIAVGDSITYGYYDSLYPAPPNPPPDPTVAGYAARTAAALRVPFSNTAYPGATMLGIVATGQHSILDQMLALTPPNRYDLIVTMFGTNDIIAYGSDATALASFSAGLRAGLLWLTSNRRVPEPRTERARWEMRLKRPASIPDGPRVFVGNTPRQSPYSPIADEAARALYASQIAADVAYVNGFGRRCYVVDVASVYDPATQSPDGIHPNPTAHAAIAAAYLEAIRAHL